MVLIFDKDTSTRRAIAINNFNEQVMETHITASYERNMGEEGFQTQDLSAFSNRQFSTIQLFSDDGIELPIQKTYNYIDMVQVSYLEAINVYQVIVSVVYHAE